MKRLLVSTFFCLTISRLCIAQSIVDPCFTSVTTIGKFWGTRDIKNLCSCIDPFSASDLLEWKNGKWMGTRPNSNVGIPPPAGCNIRAMWMGFEDWTAGGEAFGLRLDKPLTAGKIYRYTFTYAGDGLGNNGKFAPSISTTDDANLTIVSSFKIGKLPATSNWKTSTFEFTASKEQQGHNWIILHATDCSGIVLSNCIVEDPIINNFANQDTTICYGDSVTIYAPVYENYKYKWSTGDTTSSIKVNIQSEYEVTIEYGTCKVSEAVYIRLMNCLPFLEMPNIFSPNNDSKNNTFVPKAHDFIKSGTIVIYNRWGELIITEDLFQGWDGGINAESASTGVYYYTIMYIDKYDKTHEQRGIVTLVR